MEENNSPEGMPFMERLRMAFRVLFNSAFAAEVAAGLRDLQVKRAAPKMLPPEKVHASALSLLGALQREGRLIDFVQQEVTGFSDEEVGAAARVVHGGCRKVLTEYLQLEPVAPEAEGTMIRVPEGFDANRIRLTGNVTGQAPFRGTLKHHGWSAREIRLPALSDATDARVIAPAEVELS